MTSPAGRFKHRVDVLEQRDGTDPSGQPVGGWEVIKPRVPAEVLFTAGREQTRGERVEGDATHAVTLRLRGGVTQRHRLKVRHTGELLEIESVGDPEGYGRELVCVCKSVP